MTGKVILIWETGLAVVRIVTVGVFTHKPEFVAEGFHFLFLSVYAYKIILKYIRILYKKQY